MDKRVRIEKGYILYHIFSYLIDLLFICIGTLSLYFVSIYGIFNTGFNYNQNKESINNILIDYDLNYESGLEYTKYEEVIQDFYFNKYDEEIVRDFKKTYNLDYTIIHIYNCLVLGLPTEATLDTYKTSYFEYVQNDDKSFNYDLIAKKIDGNGKNYEKNMSDLFYTSYNNLKELIKEYNLEYRNAYVLNYWYEVISRAIGSIVSIGVFYLIIPLLNKERSTLGEKIFNLGHVNSRNGYQVNVFKVILRPIILFVIPIFGIIFFSKYSFIILTIGLLFLNLLFMILSPSNKDIPEILLKIEIINVKESLIFKSKEEEKAFEIKESTKN